MSAAPSSPSLLRLMQLVSPALPIGAYAYSEGLETAVELDWIRNEADASAWITGRLAEQLVFTDLPILRRTYEAKDLAEEREWARWLRATRDSREARESDAQLGWALARLLDDLGVEGAARWRRDEAASFAVSFAIGARAWGIALDQALIGYAHAAAEAQVAAAVKLVPLGQTAGQRIVLAIGGKIPEWVERAKLVDDHALGSSTPALAMAMAWHESQNVRLFRS